MAASSEKLRISSPAFANGGDMPERFSAEGENISPPLRLSNIPQNAKSLVIVVDDIDSPLGRFTHWVVWNIPADTDEIEAGELPSQAETGINGFGEVRYTGPCPPSGRHRYRFRLYALGCTLDATSPDRRDQIASDMEDCILAKADLIGCFSARE